MNLFKTKLPEKLFEKDLEGGELFLKYEPDDDSLFYLKNLPGEINIKKDKC